MLFTKIYRKSINFDGRHQFRSVQTCKFVMEVRTKTVLKQHCTVPIPSAHRLSNQPLVPRRQLRLFRSPRSREAAPPVPDATRAG